MFCLSTDISYFFQKTENQNLQLLQEIYLLSPSFFPHPSRVFGDHELLGRSSTTGITKLSWQLPALLSNIINSLSSLCQRLFRVILSNICTDWWMQIKDINKIHASRWFPTGKLFKIQKQAHSFINALLCHDH